MRDLALIFSALADTTRIEVLALLLRHDELCDFVETLGISQSKASRHLRYMWNAGLLEDRRAGLWVYYRVSRPMDPERRMRVKALGAVLQERDLPELEDRLAAWLRRKGSSLTCALPPQQHMTAPAHAPAKTHKPRPAAEARR